MKQYVHDYTLPSEAESKLFDALQECDDKNSKVAILIDQAQSTLRKYLAKDNIVEDPDADGFIKSEDLWDDDELKKIRELCSRAILTADEEEQSELVEIANVVQELLEEEPYAEINDFICREHWTLDKYKELPEKDELVLKNVHYEHILNALAAYWRTGFAVGDEDEVLEAVNICLKNYNEDPEAGYSELDDFLYEWEGGE